eukprot:Opistho-2@61755
MMSRGSSCGRGRCGGSRATAVVCCLLNDEMRISLEKAGYSIPLAGLHNHDLLGSFAVIELKCLWRAAVMVHKFECVFIRYFIRLCVDAENALPGTDSDQHVLELLFLWIGFQGIEFRDAIAGNSGVFAHIMVHCVVCVDTPELIVVFRHQLVDLFDLLEFSREHFGDDLIGYLAKRTISVAHRHLALKCRKRDCVPLCELRMLHVQDCLACLCIDELKCNGVGKIRTVVEEEEAAAEVHHIVTPDALRVERLVGVQPHLTLHWRLLLIVVLLLLLLWFGCWARNRSQRRLPLYHGRAHGGLSPFQIRSHVTLVLAICAQPKLRVTNKAKFSDNLRHDRLYGCSVINHQCLDVTSNGNHAQFTFFALAHIGVCCCGDGCIWIAPYDREC